MNESSSKESNDISSKSNSIKRHSKGKIGSISRKVSYVTTKFRVGYQRFSGNFFSLRRRRKEDNSPRRVGVATIKGKKFDNPHWINQDSHILEEIVPSFSENENSPSEGRLMYCLFDGHGPFGHYVSYYCRDNVVRILKETNYQLPMTFERMQYELENNEIDIDSSGTTCTIMIIENGHRLKIANVGDSRAVLGTKSNMDGGVFNPLPLSYEHTPDKTVEKDRIIKCGGSIYARQTGRYQKTTSSGNITVPVLGPPRVWYPLLNSPGDSMGLAMTRSLGDFSAHQVGVISEPHFLQHDILEADEFVVLASDGLWDMYSYDDCMYMMHDFIISLDDPSKWDPQEAAEMLASHARKKWEKINIPIDDITCVVISLKSIRQNYADIIG